MKKNYYASLFILSGILGSQIALGQCPAITCPGNISVNNTPGACGAAVTYNTPVGTNPCGSGTQTFSYTGSVQTFVVPAGLTSIHVEAWGAQGGTNTNDNCQIGGMGGYAVGDLAVVGGQTLNIYVGGKGMPGNVGGYNGAGNACANTATCARGGGASDVRQGGNTLNDRKIVAGGGGGAEYSACNGTGGAGGGLTGGDGSEGGAGNAHNGKGATQLVGGAFGTGSYNGTAGTFGQGGDSGNHPAGHAGSGGGGWYGGGGSSEDGHGGGGSSYIGGVTGGSTTAGARSGDGAVVFTWVGGGATTTQTAGLASGATFPVGVTTNTFQVSDGLGNTASCSFTVTVTDNENPVINAPANITVNNDPGVCGAVVNFTAPVGTDNCAVTTARTAGMASGSTFPVGTTTQTYVATDASGHTASASFTITVVDNEQPVVTVPANLTTCNPVVNGIAPSSTDNCAVAGVTYALTGATTGNGNTDASGTTFNVGTTTVTYTATDANGNSSNASFTVTVNGAYNTPATAAICQGDAIMLGGAMQTQAGVYMDTLTSVMGCDSIISTTLTVNPLPNVTLNSFPNDTVCITVAPIPLPVGNPAGGSYSGTGVVGNGFQPAVAGLGTHNIVYMYTNQNGCKGTDTTQITVINCAGLEESFILKPSVYPNPTNGQVLISLGASYKNIEVTVLELNGRLVKTDRYNYTGLVTIDLKDLSVGMYFLQIKADGQSSMVKIVKN